MERAHGGSRSVSQSITEMKTRYRDQLLTPLKLRWSDALLDADQSHSAPWSCASRWAGGACDSLGANRLHDKQVDNSLCAAQLDLAASRPESTSGRLLLFFCSSQSRRPCRETSTAFPSLPRSVAGVPGGDTYHAVKLPTASPVVVPAYVYTYTPGQPPFIAPHLHQPCDHYRAATRSPQLRSRGLGLASQASISTIITTITPPPHRAMSPLPSS